MDYSSAVKMTEAQHASLHTAANAVNDCINKDKVFVDTAAKLTKDIRCARPARVGISGLSSMDYKEFASVLEVKEFSNIETRPIPGDLRDQLKRMRSHCGMGMFPEISRAWMTIDSDLFIWNFNHGEDLAFFDGVPNSIIIATLATVKPKVFNENVHFVLAVATTVEIVLYAVCFYTPTGAAVPIGAQKDYASWDMCLLPDSVYSVNLDGAVVSGMKATADGRIFFTADDSLFELCYEGQTWFRSKCRKVNHSKGYSSLITSLFTKKDEITQLVIDDQRHVLYTLSKRKTIQVFDLGINGTDCTKVVEESVESLGHHIASHSNLDADAFKSVVSLNVVPVTESHYLNFVLVNSRGVRMYFTCLPSDLDLYYFNSIGNDFNECVRITPLSLEQSRPRTLRLVHVRIPRDYNSFRSVEDSVYMVCHSSDTTVLLKSGAYTRLSTAVFMSSASYALSPDVCENVESQTLTGLIWSIEKLTEDPSINYLTPQGMLPDINPPLAVYQDFNQPHRFYFMTSEGVSFVDRLRPTDILRSVLSTFGADSKQLAAFCSIHGPKNMMAMILSILCSTDTASSKIKEDAHRVFFLFGGEAHLGATAPASRDFFNRSAFPVDSAHGQSLIDFGPTPRTPRVTSTPFGRAAPPDLNFSGASSIYPGSAARFSKAVPRTSLHHAMPEVDSHSKNFVMSYRHDALYTYFARLLGKFWTSNVCYRTNNLLSCRYASEELTWLAGQLRTFKETIDKYNLIPITNAGFITASSAFEKFEAKVKESKSLQDLYSLLSLSCETLYLLKLINDHQFHAVTSNLSDHSKAELLSISFSDLLPADLIGALIRHYLGDNATTHSISGSLRTYCSSLFSVEDAIAAEAMELLQCVYGMTPGEDRRKLCDQAIGLVQKSILKINLHHVTDVLCHGHMFDKLVELVLFKAESEDPQKLALFAYRQGSLETDRTAADALAKRKDAYSCIIYALDILSDSANLTNVRLAQSEANAYRNEIIRTVMRSDDELANVEVFDWLVDHKMSSMLVECSNGFVEQYLHHKVETRDDVRYQDVLWRHCEKNGKFMAAATLLNDLADGRRTDVNLRQRISYLSQALVCCRSEQSNKKMHIFIQELEDKLEVAMVQDRIRESINAIAPDSQFSRAELKTATANLDQKLYSLNELFSEFAETFDLPQAKLIILRCANHTDEQTIQDVWMEIVEKEFSYCQKLGDAFRDVYTNKIAGLSRDNRNSPLYFPTDSILKYTLLKSFECGLDPVWLFGLSKVHNIGLIKILDTIYEQYENTTDPFWKANLRAEFYLANAVLRIGEEYIQSAGNGHSMQRRLTTNKFLDLLATFSISVTNGAGDSEQISSFKERCKALQFKLEHN